MTMTLDQAMAHVIEGVAMGLAQKHNLICDDGSVVCWECGKRHALLPSLHCGECLGMAYSRLKIFNPQCVNHKQEKREE